MEDGKINVKNIEQVLEVICRIIYKLLKVLFQGVTFTIEKLWETFNEKKSLKDEKLRIYRTKLYYNEVDWSYFKFVHTSFERGLEH